jgi:hypothetical protein
LHISLKLGFCSRYVYVEPVALVPDDIVDASEWLVRQLALFLGRHTSRCSFVVTLAAEAGINLADIPQTGMTHCLYGIHLPIYRSNKPVIIIIIIIIMKVDHNTRHHTL